MTLNKKQRKFANEYIKNKGNAYQAAIKAGYSKAYAKNAGKKIVENGGVQQYIQHKVGKVEQRESDEVDEVLRNIYRIGAGKPIKRHYVSVDNLKKESLDGDVSIGSRLEYMEDVTSVTPASTKEQVAAAELGLKIHGRLDSGEIEKQRARKLKADADVSEAKAAIAKQGTEVKWLVLIRYLV